MLLNIRRADVCRYISRSTRVTRTQRERYSRGTSEVHSRGRRQRRRRGLASSCPRRSKGVPMSTVTRWALNHKKIVVVFWLCLTAAGAYASLSVGNKLTKGLQIPGRPAYEGNRKMVRTFAIGGHQHPSIAALQRP